jgi:hypothetical protein
MKERGDLEVSRGFYDVNDAVYVILAPTPLTFSLSHKY